MPEQQFTVRVWICPHCGNYYGSSSAGDLNQKPVSSRFGHEERARSLCPDCSETRVECLFNVGLGPKLDGPTTAPAA